MLLKRSNAPTDSAANIKKTSRKDASERERPDRIVVKSRKNFEKILRNFRKNFNLICQFYRKYGFFILSTAFYRAEYGLLSSKIWQRWSQVGFFAHPVLKRNYPTVIQNFVNFFENYPKFETIFAKIVRFLVF